MKVTKRDLLVFSAVVAIVIVLAISSAHKKPKPVPFDDKHRSFYEVTERGRDRVETERKCVTCHNPRIIPLSKKHPPKEQCLVCHKITR